MGIVSFVNTVGMGGFATDRLRASSGETSHSPHGRIGRQDAGSISNAAKVEAIIVNHSVCPEDQR